MVTGDRAAARSRGSLVFHNRAALIRVIWHANVGWTGENAIRLELKGANVGAVAGRSIHNTRVVECTWLAALVKCGASSNPRVDRGTAWQKLHRPGWAAIVRKRGKHRVEAGQVAGPGESRRIRGVAEKIVAIAGDGAVHIRSGSRSSCCIAGAVGRGVTGYDCVVQSHTARAHADAAAGPFGHEARRLVR